MFRSAGGSAPPDASPSSALGTTSLLSWTDTPPTGSPFFYKVTAMPFFRRDITAAPVDPRSSAIIANLAAADDRFTAAKWINVLPSGSTGLASIHVTDFDMIDAGSRIALSYDRVRNP